MLHRIYYYLVIRQVTVQDTIFKGRVCVSITKGNRIYMLRSILKKCNLKVSGKNSNISISGWHQNLSISVSGENNEVILTSELKTDNTNIVLIGNNCNIVIGRGTSIGGAELVCMGNGNSIHIGSDCMLSNEIELWATDSHPIYYCNNPIPINQSAPIVIENHVWIGKRAMVLKGVRIGRNSIVGMGKIVTKDVPYSSLVVGNPSRIVKKEITWSIDRIKI